MRGQEDGPGERMRAGGSHAGSPDVPDRGQYRLPDGGVVVLFGGLGYRYWLGLPGGSGLVSGWAQFWQAVPESDRPSFVDSLKQQVVTRVRGELLARTGLLVSGSDLDRIEWLVIWGADPDLVDRLVAFEQGWSRMLPPGTRVRDLSGAQIQGLGRRVWGARPRNDAK